MHNIGGITIWDGSPSMCGLESKWDSSSYKGKKGSWCVGGNLHSN